MIGINVQEPYATLLASGQKTIETRRYKPPAKLIGQRIAIIKTNAGVAQIIGHARVDSFYQYKSKDQWTGDAGQHCVTPGSKFDWNDDSPRFAWKISKPVLLREPVAAPKRRGRIYAKDCTIPKEPTHV